MRAQAQRRTVAFTLIELLVVLAIIVTVTLLGIPAIGPMLSASSVDSAANVIKGALMHARYTAIAEHKNGTWWLIEGSVFESGKVAPPETATDLEDETATQTTYIDDSNGAPKYADTGSGWTDSTTHGDPSVAEPGSRKVSWVDNTGGASTATWTFSFDSADFEGAPKVQARIYCCLSRQSSRTNKTTYYIHATTNGGIYYHDQQTGGSGWLEIAPDTIFIFDCGQSYYVQLSDAIGPGGVDGSVSADAIKIVASPVGALDTDEAFAIDSTALDRAWTADQWLGYYVTISNQSGDDTNTLVTREIKSNTTDTVTATADWDEDLVVGSQFLISTTDLSAASTTARLSVGSGTTVSARWDQLPAGIKVSDATDDDKMLAAISFDPTGRARFAGNYVTLKVSDSETPDSKDFWRFIRVYRNTGRVVISNTLDGFGD